MALKPISCTQPSGWHAVIEPAVGFVQDVQAHHQAKGVFVAMIALKTMYAPSLRACDKALRMRSKIGPTSGSRTRRPEGGAARESNLRSSVALGYTGLGLAGRSP